MRRQSFHLRTLYDAWLPIVQAGGDTWTPLTGAAKPTLFDPFMNATGTSGFINPLTLNVQLASDLLWFERPFSTRARMESRRGVRARRRSELHRDSSPARVRTIRCSHIPAGSNCFFICRRSQNMTKRRSCRSSGVISKRFASATRQRINARLAQTLVAHIQLLSKEQSYCDRRRELQRSDAPLSRHAPRLEAEFRSVPLPSSRRRFSVILKVCGHSRSMRR